jgi:hypothetical protein
MAEITDTPQRVEARLDPDELRALDHLCATDLRTRPNELKWLIAAETERRLKALDRLAAAS